MPVLFLSDWEKFPTAIADTQTKNKSWLRFSVLLRKMGVKNTDFHLTLLQPDLQGVDPYSPDLTKDQMFKIRIECKYNPWYFLREVARVPASGQEPVPLRANRGNISLFWSYFNHIDYSLVQIRQTGKTVSTTTLMNGLVNVWAQRSTFYLVTKDNTLKQKTVRELKEMRDTLPEYIYTPNRDDADNKEYVNNLLLRNEYVTAVGRADRVGADKLGRGLTSPTIHFDEMGYIANIGVTLPVALSSGSAARDSAAAAGAHYGNVYTTTAGSLGDRDGAAAYNFMTSGAVWNDSFYDCPDNAALMALVEANSTGDKPMIYGAFNHRQLGYSDEWLYRKIRENAARGEVADRDFFNIWTAGAEGSPLTPDEKRTVKASQSEPLYTEITENNYILRWYLPESEITHRMGNGRFVMGNDTSEALGGNNDAIGVVILDAYSHDVVCCGRFNATNLDKFGDFIAELIERFPTITYIPERKSSAITILDKLFIKLPMRGIDPFRRIYNRIVDDPENFSSEYKEIQRPLHQRNPGIYERLKRHFGFVTAGSGRNSRDALYGDALNSVLRYGSKRLYDETLIGELLGLTIKNGRIDHSGGKHDDVLISLLLAHWLLTKGRNLSFYGIDPRRIFSESATEDEGVDEIEMAKRRRAKMYYDEIQEIMDHLKTIQDPMMISKYEARLRQLSQKVDVSELGGVGIDALVQQSREERQRRSKLSRFGGVGGREQLQRRLNQRFFGT
jgi:hypothetical protein